MALHINGNPKQWRVGQTGPEPEGRIAAESKAEVAHHPPQVVHTHLPANWSNVKRFRGGLVFKAHRLVYHSTLGWRVIKKKKTISQSASRQYQSVPARKNMANSKGLIVTLSVRTSPCPYAIAYRRGYGLSTSGLFEKSVCSPVCGKATWDRRASGRVGVLNSRTTTSQKCAAVPRRARI